MIGSIKCRLKSSSAWSGVGPTPLDPGRRFDPIKASQRSPTIPILGRNRAAGLRGWCSRNSSTSSFMAAGSSSIASDVTLLKRLQAALWTSNSAKNPREMRCVLASLCETGSIIPGSYASNQSRPHSMATEVVRLPPMLNVRNFFAFSI